MEKFEIEITSVPDRSELVAEIWYNSKLIAEINRENMPLELVLYGQMMNKLIVPFDEFIEVLEMAKKKLIS